MRAPFAVVIAILLGCHAAAARAEWIAEVETAAVHESNLSHGQLQRDIKSDTALEVAASAGEHFALGDYSGLSITGNAKSAAYDRYGGLNHLDLGAAAALRSKLGLGAAAPWWRVAATATRLDYRNDVRDGWLYTLGSGAGMRVGEKWNIRGDYTYERRTADQDRGIARGISGAVFNQKSHSVQLNADYAFSAATSISAGYMWRIGDVAATTLRNFTIFSASTAIAADPAFGADTIAYKLRAVTHVLSIGVSQALNARSSLNFGLERQISHGTGNNDYYNNIVRLVFAYSF
jgi:hypothetical protein